MQSGDIFIQASLHGEPQKLLTYWRGHLRDVLPSQASVKICREVPFDKMWRVRDGVYFDAIMRTEKKRAELSISEASLKMSADEIADARFLTDLLFGWLSGRTAIPELERRLPSTEIFLRAEGGLEILDAVEQFTDQELIGDITVGVAYMQGNPRRPVPRFLPSMINIATKTQIDEIKNFETLLTEAQVAGLKDTIGRIAGVFRKRLKARKVAASARAQKVLGIGLGGVSLHDRPVTDEVLMSYKYYELLSWLKSEEKEMLRRRENLGRRTMQNVCRI